MVSLVGRPWQRLDGWKAAFTALQERPILGHGPGLFRHATTEHLTLEFARAEGPDRVFYDAHNVFVEYATATGLIGLALLVALVVMLARSTRGPLAVFAAAVSFTWLLEPASLHTASLVLLALGAAGGAATREMVTDIPRVALGASASSLSWGRGWLGFSWWVGMRCIGQSRPCR